MSTQMQLIAIGISVIWIGAILYYLFSSRRHLDISREIESLRKLVDKQQDE